jgi:O-antigen/teichoic acid export membrane protein
MIECAGAPATDPSRVAVCGYPEPGARGRDDARARSGEGVKRPAQRAEVRMAAVDEGLLERQPEVSARTVGRALSWAGLGQILGLVAWNGSLFVLAALVQPAAFGAVTAALVVTATASLLIGAGTRGAIITSERLTTEHLRYALAVNVTVGIVAAAVVIALADPLASALLPGADPTVLRWLMMGVALHALAVVPLAVLQKNMQFKAQAGITVASSFTTSAVSIVAGILGAGIWALVLRQVVGSVFEVVLAWIVARRHLPPLRSLVGRGSRPTAGRGAAAKWFFLVSIFSLVAMSVDYVVVGRLAGATELGLYSIAFALGFAPLTQLSWWLGGVLLPAAAATRDPDLLAQRTVRTARAMALMLLPLVVPALLLAPWLLPLTLGDRWTSSVVVFQILFPIGVAHGILNVVAESLGGGGHVKLHVQMLGLWAIAITTLLLILVPAAGIRGAALAHLVVLVPLAAGYLVLGARRLGLPKLALLRGLAGVAPPFLFQAAITLSVFWTMAEAGAPDSVARVVAVATGFAGLAGLFVVRPNGAFLETRALLIAARRGA